MHKCTIATITVHICTVTIVCAFNILIISDSLFLFSLSLFSICKTNPPSHVLSSSDTHTPTTQNQKSTIKIQNQPQNQQKKSTTRTKSLDQWSVIMDHELEMQFGSVIWIGVDGDRWWVDVNRCWWRLVLMEIDNGLTEISVNGDRFWWSAYNGLTEKKKKDS